MVLNRKLVSKIILIAFIISFIFGFVVSNNAYADIITYPSFMDGYQYKIVAYDATWNCTYAYYSNSEMFATWIGQFGESLSVSATDTAYSRISWNQGDTWQPEAHFSTKNMSNSCEDGSILFVNYDLYESDSYNNLIYSNTDVETYTISPGQSFSFETSFSVVDTNWNMDFDIESGTQTGSMTFYKDNDYEYADFNLMISTLSSSVISSGTITPTFSENGNYTLVNNTGYTLSYTDDNPAIEVLSLNSGYYLATIGTTVLLDMTDETESYPLTATPNNGGTLKLSYARTDSDGYTIQNVSDSGALFTLEPGYKYYFMWENEGYTENDYVSFTSPVVPGEPDLWLDEYDNYNIIDWLISPWKEYIIGDDENYFDITNISTDTIPSGQPAFNAELEMSNAKFKVKHYKSTDSGSTWNYYKTYTIENTSKLDLFNWGLTPNVDKLEFYLQYGTATLKITRAASLGDDYLLNMSYKSIGLYETIQEAIEDSENIETTEGDSIIDQYRNDTGDDTPTTQEIIEWIDGTSIPSYNPDYVPVVGQSGLPSITEIFNQSKNILGSATKYLIGFNQIYAMLPSPFPEMVSLVLGAMVLMLGIKIIS